MSKTTITRRALLAGSAVLAAAPALALEPVRQPHSHIAMLWRQAETAKGRLGTEMMTLQAGVPAWMRTGGEVSAIGETRYQALTGMLGARPAHAADLALMAKAAREAEMVHGPRAWADDRVLQAARSLQA